MHILNTHFSITLFLKALKDSGRDASANYQHNEHKITSIRRGHLSSLDACQLAVPSLATFQEWHIKIGM